jgi:hypothetical protein
MHSQIFNLHKKKKSSHIYKSSHIKEQEKYNYIRYINNYVKNIISTHSLFIIIILYF